MNFIKAFYAHQFRCFGLSLLTLQNVTSSVSSAGVYLVVIMVLTSISVAMCVFILHLHRLGASGVRVLRCLQILVTRYLARLVGMTSLIKHHHSNVEAGACEETTPLWIECDDFSSRYKLIQVEGSGLYILAKDSEPAGHLDKEDKEDINDLHRVRDKGIVLKPMKAVIVQPGQYEYKNTVTKTELIWHDIAEVLDRFFFWMCFLTVTLCNVTILVIIPRYKPDIPTNTYL